MSNKYFDTPTGSPLYSIEKAIKVYRKLCQENISKVISGITVDQALILIILDKEKDFTQMEIARLAFKDNASITRILRLMEGNGYIHRKPNLQDKRRSHIEITKKGIETLKLLGPTIKQNRATALQGFSGRETQMLQKLLEKIIDNCKKDQV